MSLKAQLGPVRSVRPTIGAGSCRKTGLLLLFRGGTQGYSPLESTLNGSRFGKCPPKTQEKADVDNTPHRPGRRTGCHAGRFRFGLNASSGPDILNRRSAGSRVLPLQGRRQRSHGRERRCRKAPVGGLHPQR